MRVDGSNVEVDGTSLMELAHKTKLTEKDWQRIVEQVVLPFINEVNENACGRQLYEYQTNVAKAICAGVLSGNGWMYSIVQARQCIGGDQVVELEDGTLAPIKDAPNSWLTGVGKHVYRIVTRNRHIIEKITKEHVVFTQRGEVYVGDLVPGDCLWTNPVNKGEYDTVLERDLELSIITSLEPNGTSDVYDMEVPDKHCFMCNGIKVHNSGKSETVACVVMGLGLLIPVFKKVLKDESFLFRFKSGFLVGCFGPTLDKANIIYNRIKEKLSSEAAISIMTSEGGVDPKNSKGMHFSNGFRVDLKTAKKGSSIEGMTYHLATIDECQEVDAMIIQKSIMPMLATISGSLVLIGTPRPEICYFKEALEKAKERDIRMKRKAPYTEYHEYDWVYVAEANPFYLDHVKMMIDEVGRHGDAFLMAYDIKWIDHTGRFISQEELMTGAVRVDRKKSTNVYNSRTKQYELKEFLLHSGFINHSHDETEVVFAIDYGKAADSTVITLAKVWWDNPITTGAETRYHIHIYDWRPLDGDNHEKQHPQILNAISQYNCKLGVSDATGKGDPIHTRLEAVLQDPTSLAELGMSKPVEMHPFIFSPRSKHEGYTMLKQEICAGRVTFPYAEYTHKYNKSKRFIKETSELTKSYRNNTMVIDHPEGDKYHDDFPDSLMMLVWAVNKFGVGTATNQDNPFQRNRNKGWILPTRKQNKFNGKSVRRKPFWRS